MPAGWPPIGSNDWPAILNTTYSLVPAPVSVGVMTRRDVADVGAVPVYGRSRYDYRTGGRAVVAVGNVVVCEVAACDCHCDYCQYDCRY